jgi:hypothetical protein
MVSQRVDSRLACSSQSACLARIRTWHALTVLAAESACQWLDETAETTRRQLASSGTDAEGFMDMGLFIMACRTRRLYPVKLLHDASWIDGISHWYR